jgi:D-tyrosyl-tRNA(Tyr) deacylase
LLPFGARDTEIEADMLANKIANLRIFADMDSKFNLSVLDVGGEILVISQFTLYADSRKGRRPSFTDAARPEAAAALIESFVARMRTMGVAGRNRRVSD